MAPSLTRATALSNKLPNHISDAYVAVASKYKNILRTVSLGGGGGQDPQRGPHREGEIPRDLAPGGEIHRDLALGGRDLGGGGSEIPGTPEFRYLIRQSLHKYLCLNQSFSINHF